MAVGKSGTKAGASPMAIGGTFVINSITYTIVGQVAGPQDQWVLGDSGTTRAYDNRGLAKRFIVALYLTTDVVGTNAPVRYYTTNHFKFALEYLADWIASRNKSTMANRANPPVALAATILTIVNKTAQTLSISDGFSGAPINQNVSNRFSVTDSLRVGVTRRFRTIREAFRAVWYRIDSKSLHD